MRFLILFALIFTFASSSDVYKRNCASCRGMWAEATYLGKVPPIRSMDSKRRLQALKDYKYGNINKYGYGIIMKANIVKFGDTRIKDSNNYIETFKNDLELKVK